MRDKRGEFIKGRPPVFTHSADPIKADDWLRALERQLNIAQCNVMEKVLYASGQLQATAQTWWESYQAARPKVILLSHGWNFPETFEHDISMKE